MRKRGKRAGIIVIAIVAIIVAVIVVHSFGSRAELNEYKASLRARGEKLTLAELAIPISTNAAHVASRKVFFTNVFDRPTIMISMMQFVGPGMARTAWGPEVVWVNWSAVEQERAKSADMLAVFRSALDDPAPDGWDYHNTISNAVAPRMNYISERSVIFGLCNDELIALRRGDLPGAIADIHAMVGLVRLNRNELTLNQPMIACGSAMNGLNGTWEALQAPGWSEQQLAGVQHDWEQVDLFAMLERGFLGERVNNQEFMANVRAAGGREFDDYTDEFHRGATNRFPAIAYRTGLFGEGVKFVWTYWRRYAVPVGYKIFSANEDELVQLRYFSETIDAVRLLRANHPWSEAENVLTNAVNEVDGRLKRDVLKRLMFSHITLANNVNVVQSIARYEIQRRLTVTGIALKRYQLKNGKPPPDLAALVPEFIAAVPLDPMSGKPLCYRLNSDSTFVLYSVGGNGKDDGGAAGLGLWSQDSLDVVWPTVGSADQIRQSLTNTSGSR